MSNSVVRKNVVNYAQTQVIAADLIRVRDNENPGAALSWQGNSYSGARRSDGVYILMHWNTVIAAVEFHRETEKLVLIYFNARHISSTTRGFQGRILKALDKIGVWGTSQVKSELGKPTHKRHLIVCDENLEYSFV